MKTNLHLFRKKVIRSFLGLFSLSAMLFIFQACYGTPQDFGQDILIEGQVTSASNQTGIRDIQVNIQNLPQYTQTDEKGRFSLYCPRQTHYTLTFTDTDGDLNGSFPNQSKELTLQELQKEASLNILLQGE